MAEASRLGGPLLVGAGGYYSNMRSNRETIEAAFHNLDAALDDVAALTYDALTVIEKTNLLARLEVHRRRLPAAEHPLINQLGGTSLADALATALRVSGVPFNRKPRN